MTSESLAFESEIISLSPINELAPLKLMGPIQPSISPFNEVQHLSQLKAILESVMLKKAFTSDDILLASEAIKNKLENKPGQDIKVAEFNGIALGFICYSRVPASESSYEIEWLAVHPYAQGNGIGSMLVSMAEKDIRGKSGKIIILETTSKKEYSTARHLYEKSGYKIVSRLYKLYSEKEDHLTYRKDI